MDSHGYPAYATHETLLARTATFRPNWISRSSWWVRYLHLAYWLIGRSQPRVLVELGTQAGDSYMGMCQAVREWGLPTRCFAVDTWKGDPHSGTYPEAIYQRLADYEAFCYGDFSTLMRCTFDQAVDSVADGSIDLLHIDGYHTYQAVRHDFDTWLPKMAPGGVVMLHDIDVYHHDFGVYRLWDELKQRFPHFFEAPGFPGLGLIQITPTSPETLLVLPQPGSDEAFLLAQFLGKLGEYEIFRQDAIALHQKELDRSSSDLVKQLISAVFPSGSRVGHLLRKVRHKFFPTSHVPDAQILPQLVVKPGLLPADHPPLYHFYHVYADGHWQPIVLEHFAALKKSGLLDRLGGLYIGCVGHPTNRHKVWDLVRALGIKFEVAAEADGGYEQVTLEPLYRFSLSQEGLVLYAHTKGSYNDVVLNHRWRRSMAHFMISCWPQATAYLTSHEAVGCHWITRENFPRHTDRRPYFGGNFWWAQLGYLKRIGSPKNVMRYDAEMWIGEDPQVKVFDLNPGWPDSGSIHPVAAFNGVGAP
jgi:hypothetical protein